MIIASTLPLLGSLLAGSLRRPDRRPRRAGRQSTRLARSEAGRARRCVAGQGEAIYRPRSNSARSGSAGVAAGRSPGSRRRGEGKFLKSVPVVPRPRKAEK